MPITLITSITPITPITDIYDVIEDSDNPGKIKLASGAPTRDTRVDTHELDATGNLTAFKKSVGSDTDNANARVSNQTFDDDGRLQSASVALASVDNPKSEPAKPGDSATTTQTVQKTYVHNAFNKKLVEVDESHYAHFYVYDADQQLIYEVSPTGAIRHYERNSFGEVIKLTQYATPITLDLTQSTYLKNGLTQAQIEASGVIVTNSDDRTITFDYNQSAVRTNTTLPPQLLAWIDEDQNRALSRLSAAEFAILQAIPHTQWSQLAGYDETLLAKIQSMTPES